MSENKSGAFFDSIANDLFQIYEVLHPDIYHFNY